MRWKSVDQRGVALMFLIPGKSSSSTRKTKKLAWTSHVWDPAGTDYYLVGPGRSSGTQVNLSNKLLVMDEVAMSDLQRTVEELRRDAYVVPLEDPLGPWPGSPAPSLPNGLSPEEAKWPVGLAYDSKVLILGECCSTTRSFRCRHSCTGASARAVTLRNVQRTGPYLHDGSLTSLQAVVEHYNDPFAHTDRIGQADRHLRPLGLTTGEVTALVAFLNSLNSP